MDDIEIRDLADALKSAGLPCIIVLPDDQDESEDEDEEDEE